MVCFLPFLFFTHGCFAQKMVRKAQDAKRLEINKSDFIGKPFKTLLNEIAPNINYLYGNPDNTSPNAIGGTYIRLFFENKDIVRKKINKNGIITGIRVVFKLETRNNRKHLPKGGVKLSKEEIIKLYGDMIVLDVHVSSKDEVK